MESCLEAAITRRRLLGWSALAALSGFAGVGGAAAADKPFVPTSQYAEREVNGWAVHVNRHLLGDQSELGTRALRLLEVKLYDLARVVPERAVAHLQAEGFEAHGVTCDVRHLDQMVHLADESFRLLGQVDVVFSNAGIVVAGPLAAMTHEDWRWVIDIDLWGSIHAVEDAEFRGFLAIDELGEAGAGQTQAEQFTDRGGPTRHAVLEAVVVDRGQFGRRQHDLQALAPRQLRCQSLLRRHRVLLVSSLLIMRHLLIRSGARASLMQSRFVSFCSCNVLNMAVRCARNR